MNPQTNELDQTPVDPSLDQSVPFVSSGSETDLNNLRGENDRLRTELRVRTARDELTKLLTADRARSPELLFEASTNRLDFDDNGHLKNTSDLIAELKQRFPEQFTADRPEPPAPLPDEGWPKAGVVGAPVINAGAGRTGSRLPLTKEALAAMKPEEITKLDWNDVKQVMES